MAKFRETFFYEFITSFPFKLFVFIVMIILMALYIHNCNDKKVIKMKEDVLYIKPTS